MAHPIWIPFFITFMVSLGAGVFRGYTRKEWKAFVAVSIVGLVFGALCAYFSPEVSSRFVHSWEPYLFGLILFGLFQCLVSFAEDDFRAVLPQTATSLTLTLLVAIGAAAGSMECGRAPQLAAILGGGEVEQITVNTTMEDLVDTFLEISVTDDQIRNYVDPPDSEVGAVDFASVAPPMDADHIRVIPRSSAVYYMDKAMGEHGTQFTLGEPTLQRHDGELVWIAPIDHRGFFTWNRTKVTPGYIMVSAERLTGRADLVLVDEGLRCTEGAFFAHDLTRVIRRAVGHRYLLREYSFELDDEGHPHYTVSAVRSTQGMIGRATVGTYVVDAVTCEVEFFQRGETPGWVDRVIPREEVSRHIGWWGEYAVSQRWCNPSREGVIEVSGDVWMNYGHDGDPYWFTAMTSAGADDSIVGFVQVHAISGASTFYRLADGGGIHEAAAENTIDSLVSNFNDRVTTSPSFYNIEGMPTYVVPVTNRRGEIQHIGLVSMVDPSLDAIGDTPAEAYRAYREAISERVEIDLGEMETFDRSAQESVTGTLLRVNLVGDQRWVFIIREDSRMYYTTGAISPRAGIMRDGDYVTFGVNPEDTGDPVQAYSVVPSW